MGALIRMRVDGSADLVVVRQRTRQIARHVGIDDVTATRLSTALSELAREAVADGGATLEVELADGRLAFHVVSAAKVSPAIAARLVEHVEPTSQGIRLWLPLPAGAPDRRAIAAALAADHPGSAVDEIQIQARELVHALEEKAERERELVRLNRELASVNARLRSSEAALRRSNADLERFASAAAHDLREPLAGIAIFAGLIEMSADSDELRGHAHQIEAACQRMSGMLRGLMDYARLDTAVPVEPRANGDAVAAEVRDNLQAAIAAQGATVRFDPLPELAVAPIHLLQLLQNLVGNALKYRRPDTPPAVHVSCAPQAVGGAPGWALSVADNGRGIPVDMRDRVFGLFQRLARDRDEEGSGVGLALVARIAERYGGTVGVTSEEGVGSTFTVTLPAFSP